MIVVIDTAMVSQWVFPLQPLVRSIGRRFGGWDNPSLPTSVQRRTFAIYTKRCFTWKYIRDTVFPVVGQSTSQCLYDCQSVCKMSRLAYVLRRRIASFSFPQTSQASLKNIHTWSVDKVLLQNPTSSRLRVPVASQFQSFYSTGM